MLVKKKGSDDINLKSFDDFKLFVNEIINNIKDGYIDSSENIKNYFNQKIDNEISFIKIKNEIKDFFYNKTILNNKYWLSRGWDLEESIQKIKDEQIKRSKKGVDKNKKLKETDYKKWAETNNTKIEYYLKSGYNLDEAKKVLKERQSTFSKEKCISKFGYEKGIDIFNKRQEKWIESLNISYNKESYPEKDSKSINLFNDIKDCINSVFLKNKELLIDAITYSGNNFDLFIEYISNNKEIYTINEISYIFNSKTLQNYFNLKSDEIKQKIIEKYGIIPSRFGNIRYLNNHICRSNGEYYIANYLVKNNIEYEYEKKYKNSTFICDFYLKKYEIYVEYMGFLKSDWYKDTKMIEDYKNKYDVKKRYCINNKLNFIYESDYKIIIQKINEIYGIRN